MSQTSLQAPFILPEVPFSPSPFSTLELLPTVIVLAAGLGTRFTQSGGEGSKLNAQFRGSTVLAHTLSAVSASGLPHHVVTPFDLANQVAGTGMCDSIARGVAATRDAAGWLILPADLPCILPSTLQCVAQALMSAGGVVQAFVNIGDQSQAAHPVGFGRECLNKLLALAGNLDDTGARSVVQHYKAISRWQALTSEDLGAIQDVDTVADLARLAHQIKPIKSI